MCALLCIISSVSQCMNFEYCPRDFMATLSTLARRPLTRSATAVGPYRTPRLRSFQLAAPLATCRRTYVAADCRRRLLERHLRHASVTDTLRELVSQNARKPLPEVTGAKGCRGARGEGAKGLNRQRRRKRIFGKFPRGTHVPRSPFRIPSPLPVPSPLRPRGTKIGPFPVRSPCMRLSCRIR